RALDAIDPEVWHFRGQLIYPVDGRQVGGDQSQEAVLARKWQRRAEIYRTSYYRFIRHVVDWLWVAAQENHAWLHNRDSQGRPKKLLKASTIEDLAREADKFLMRQLDQHRSEIMLTADDEQFLLDLGAGYSLVRLLTPWALDQESVALKH
ncbi:hypothetical protein HER21_33340, partial [Pseudomonas sp. BGM005]|nr:hypothetical protein [Pseudomonas sp. BG5]